MVEPPQAVRVFEGSFRILLECSVPLFTMFFNMRCVRSTLPVSVANAKYDPCLMIAISFSFSPRTRFLADPTMLL